MNYEDLKNFALKESQQPPRHHAAKDKIREAVDPNSEFLEDSEIYHIILKCGGDLRRSTHKCLLAIYVKALQTRNGPLVTRSRDMIHLHEAGLLI